MNNKEEIFKQMGINKGKWFAYEGDLAIFTHEEILEAMDEYAKQVALLFYQYEESLTPEQMEHNYYDFIKEYFSSASKQKP